MAMNSVSSLREYKKQYLQRWHDTRHALNVIRHGVTGGTHLYTFYLDALVHANHFDYHLIVLNRPLMCFWLNNRLMSWYHRSRHVNIVWMSWKVEYWHVK
jgi:hypothetical protein